ncbi:MAG TPA: cytochrome P460 family protein [Nitrospiraceae bacterium]|nr:cytochrome P460 family protein [Nitrospiraceae bacterium]
MKTLTTLWTGTALTVFHSSACSVYAQDVTVSEKSFSCIRDGTKIRNTYIKNADPAKLKEAVRIFKNSVPDREYPIGTFLQLVPFEVMVKHPRDKFPDTNGWEFFALELSKQGTKIRDRGDKVVNLSQGVTCLSCHQPAARFDFVCEKGHGCAPLPIDDQKIAELQGEDPRCPKK